mgnify:CR=1 FL=1
MLYKYFCGVLFFLCHFYSQFFEGFLIDSSDISEPFSVGIDSGLFSGPFMHFFFIRHFLIVHVESFDGAFGSHGASNS